MTGFVVVDKAAGASSAREVNIIKKLTKTPCGHMGTLDPMATGVLPIAIGNAARLFDYFLEKRKTYKAVFRFGVDSDTLDTTGELRENAGRIPDRREIEEVLTEFIGEIDQLPPKYSAKNVAGKRAYELARSGVEFELPRKRVNIYSIKLLSEEEDGYGFEIECGGGTYIRSIARDIAEKLGTVAVMSSLIRTKSGCFGLESAVKTEKLTAENIGQYIIPTQNVLPYDSINPTEKDAKRLFNGLSVQCDLSDGIYKLFHTDGSFYGLGEAKHNTLKVRTKLC